MRLSVGSLFAGIGGFDLGFERAGFEIKWQVEIDPFCRAVLAKHWPDVRRYEDVRECCGNVLRARRTSTTEHENGPCAECGRRDWLPGVDVIVGGFPCQDVSLAGIGAGLDGERSGLWTHLHRIVCELRPRYVVVENTEGLLARGLDRVLGELAEAGYDAEWQCIQARDVGAPHERERVFIVAYPNKGDGQARLGNFAHGSRPLFAGDYPQRYDFWLQAPRQALGMDDGIHGRAYEQCVGSLGNAIVPQIAEWIARRILQAEEGLAGDTRHE